MSKNALAWIVQIGVILLAAAIYIPAFLPVRIGVTYHRYRADEYIDILRDVLARRTCSGLPLPVQAASLMSVLTECDAWPGLRRELVDVSDHGDDGVVLRWGSLPEPTTVIRYRKVEGEKYVLTIVRDRDPYGD